MPGLVVFRRRWSVGSDDLIVPGAFLLTIHVLWSLQSASIFTMLRFAWFSMACLAIPHLAFGLLSPPYNSSESSKLIEFTSFIARVHFPQFTKTVIIVEDSLELETSTINTQMVDSVSRNLQETIAVQLHIGFGSRNEQPWDYYIFFVDSLGAFRKLLSRFPKDNHDRDFHFLVVLTKCTENFHNFMERVFQLSYDFHVIDVNIILDHPILGISVFTYYLFAEDQCRVIEPKLVFRASEGFDSLKVFFPRKLSNFHGCPMSITSRAVQPFLIFHGDKSNPKPIGDWTNLLGIEGMLLRFLANAFNFSIHLLPFPTEHSMIVNSTAYGCFSELLNGSADIAIGSFSSSDPGRKMFSISKLYHFTPYKYVIRGGRVLDSLDRLLRPFNFQLWNLILCALSSAVVIVLILQFTKPEIRLFVLESGNKTHVFNIIAIFLGNPLSRAPRETFPRFLFTMWLSLTLILRSAYQGGLYDAIRLDKFNKAPWGYKELIEWNYKIYLSPEVAQLEMFDNPLPLRIVPGDFRTRFRIIERSSEKLATVALVENYVSYMEAARHFDIHLFLMAETIYINQMAIFLPKQSIFLGALNEKLSVFLNAGLSIYFKKWFLAEKAFFKWTLEEPQRAPITIIRLKSMFVVFVVMIGVALLLFGLELLSVRFVRLKRMFVFLNSCF